MDPTATLRKMRNLITALEAVDEMSISEIRTNTLVDIGQDLAEAFQDLDYWLSKGGFLPADWQQAPPTNPCPYTHAHTRYFCGYDTCRDS